MAPTLEIEQLLGLGISGSEAPELIASAFRQLSSRGVAVCNTIAVSGFHAALAEQEISVLSWLHELPTFIETWGGAGAIEAVKAASRKIIIPANAVRDALIDRFGIAPDRLRTLYYGIDPRTLDLSRESMRQAVREEFGLPRDAHIVLGCGTVNLRKGADLFVNIAPVPRRSPIRETGDEYVVHLDGPMR